MRSSKKILFCISFLSLFIIISCKSGKDLAKNQQTSTNEKSTGRIQNKYALLLNIPKNEISNLALYAFIDEWYGAPYKYGGRSKNGIDCSNFVSELYQNIYHLSVSGSSSSIYNQCKPLSRNALREGDLLFFKIEKDNISHIGVYLQNNKFVHATTKKGVMIDDLDEAYYKKYFYKAGRLTTK